MTKLINELIKFFSQTRTSRLEAYIRSQQPLTTVDIDRLANQYFQKNSNYIWGV